MKTLLLSSTLLIAACQPKTVTNTIFLLQRDVPQNPSFVVLPANNYLYQIEFANEIEHYLIFCGVSVQNRPASREIQTTKELKQMDAQPSQAAQTKATMVERFFALDETTADYVVYTYADSRQVKILNRATSEILASFDFTNMPKVSERLIFRDALKKLGVAVREAKP